MNTSDEFSKWMDEWMMRVDRGEVPGPRKWRGAKPPSQPPSRPTPKQFQPGDERRAVAAAEAIIRQHQRKE